MDAKEDDEIDEDGLRANGELGDADEKTKFVI